MEALKALSGTPICGDGAGSIFKGRWISSQIAAALVTACALGASNAIAITPHIAFIGAQGSTLERAVVLANGSAVRYSAVDRTITVTTYDGVTLSKSIDEIASAFPSHAADLLSKFGEIDSELVDPSLAVELSNAQLVGNVAPPTPFGYPLRFPDATPWSPGGPPGDFQIQANPAPLVPYSTMSLISGSNDPNSPFGPCSFAPCSPWTSPGFRGSVRVTFQLDSTGGGNGSDPIDTYDRELFERWRGAQCEAARDSAIPVGLGVGGFAGACAVAAVSTGPAAPLACVLAAAYVIYETSQTATLARNCSSPYPGRGNWGP